MRILAALIGSLVLLAAPALAQTEDLPFAGLELTLGPLQGTVVEDDQVRVPYKGTGTFEATVRIGCLDILQALPTATVDVAVQAPDWMATAPVALEFSPQDCSDPSGFAQKVAQMAFTLKPEAPGVIPQTLNVTATFGELAASQPLTMAVGYNAEYVVVPDVTFPLQTKGATATFNLTVTQKSNARSMVMFENVRSDRGSISGLASVPYDRPPESKTFKVTYKAPTGAWTDAKVEFTSYGHYLLDFKTGPFMAPKPVTWTFVNANPGGSEPTDNESPLNGWVLLAALLGAAMLAARRNK